MASAKSVVVFGNECFENRVDHGTHDTLCRDVYLQAHFFLHDSDVAHEGPGGLAVIDDLVADVAGNQRSPLVHDADKFPDGTVPFHIRGEVSSVP